MPFLNFFSGTISGKSKFLSTEDIRHALSDSYRLSVIEQSYDIIRCRLLIPKYWLGFCWYEIGPHPKISVKIDRGQKYSNITYDFFWLEYLFAFVYSILIGVAVISTTNDLLVISTVYLLALIALVCIFNLQTKAHSISIRMILEKL